MEVIGIDLTTVFPFLGLEGCCALFWNVECSVKRTNRTFYVILTSFSVALVNTSV